MDYEPRVLKTQKFILEIEVSGDEADFANCEQLGESLIKCISQILRLTDTRRFKFMWTAFLKPMPQRSNKAHADVQLPHLNGNGVVKAGCKVEQKL